MSKEKQKIEKPDNENKQAEEAAPKPIERGGPEGPEPTRYGDWEIGGKCVDF